MKYETERGRIRLPINDKVDGYKIVNWMLSKKLAFGTWNFTARAIWINDTAVSRKIAMEFRLKFDN